MEPKPWFKSKKLWNGVIILATGIIAIITGDQQLDATTIAGLLTTVFGIYQTILAIQQGDPTAFGNKVFGRKE